MATSNQAKSSSVFKILWEALIILVKNWNYVLIFIPMYFISPLLTIFNSSSITPILTDLQRNLVSLKNLKPPNPDFYRIMNAILTGLREITIIEAIFYVTIFVVSILVLTSTLCFVYMTYNEKKPTVKELFSRIRKTWKGVMITQFYLTIFINMSCLLMFLLIGGFIIVSMNSVGFQFVSSILTILAFLLYLYLVMIRSFSLVVAVEEEGIYGLAAIVRAMEIMKGRRWKGIFIALIMMLFTAVYFIPMLLHPSFEMKSLVIRGVFLAVAAVVNVFELAIIIVFYFECKQRDEGLIIIDKSGFGYSSLPTKASSIDSVIP